MKKVLIALAFTFAASSQAAAGPLVINVDQASAGAVSFVAVGKPSMLRIKGTGGPPHGKIEIKGGKASGELDFDLDSLETGMNLRNKHMKEKYLETGKFPKAKLMLTDVSVPAELASDKSKDVSIDKLPFQGILNVHGKDSPVTGEAKVTRKGGTIDVDAHFDTKTTAHEIPTPTFAGITVGENVTVSVQFTAPIEAAK